MKKFMYGSLVTLVLIFLLTFPSDGLEASRIGLGLWFNTLLPTLLPFLILSGFLIRADLVSGMLSFLTPFFRWSLGISGPGAYALITGFFCGYPVGAKVLADLVKNQQIHPAEAEYLLGFCNNVSPAFIITFLAIDQLKRPELILPTLLLVYGCPLLYGFLKNPSYRKECVHVSSPKRKTADKKASDVQINFELIDACILDGASTMVKLGGYIILFSIIARMISCFPAFSPQLSACLIGITELTNGIPALINASAFPKCYPLLLAITAFGGLSSIAQTESVVKSAQLSVWKYFISKIWISLFTGIGAFLYCTLFL